MPSHNMLLGSGNPADTERKPHVHEGTPQLAWRYHQTCPKGILCKTKEEIEKYDGLGWVDTPGKVIRLPGWEKLYDDYQASLNGEKAPEATIELTPEQIEDAKKADALKEASDKLETKRLEDIEKAARGPEKFVCDECGKEFEKPQALRMHKMSAHKQKKAE